MRFHLELCKELPDQACAPLAASVHARITRERLAFTPCTWTLSRVPEEEGCSFWGFWGFELLAALQHALCKSPISLVIRTGGPWRLPGIS